MVFELSRAYDLLRLAGGRTTDEELRKDARERVAKHREAKKIAAAKAKTPVSVTVTETSGDQHEPESVWPRNEPVASLDPLGPIKRQIETLPYEQAHRLSLWLTDHLIAIRPELKKKDV
jgi:hypothetical protein